MVLPVITLRPMSAEVTFTQKIDVIDAEFNDVGMRLVKLFFITSYLIKTFKLLPILYLYIQGILHV